MAEICSERAQGDPALGAIIKAAREAKGWNQEQVASILGVSKASVSQWENGRNAITDSHRRSLAAALSIPLETMFSVPRLAGPITQRERLLIELFRQLPDDTQKAFLHILEDYHHPRTLPDK